MDRLDRRLSGRHDVAVSQAASFASPRLANDPWRNGPSTTRSCSSIGSTTANVHDLGFIFLSTYLPWYRADAATSSCTQVLIQAGRTLAMRFKEKGQYLRSFVAPNRCSSTS